MPKLKVFLKLHTRQIEKKMLGGLRELLAHLLLDLFKGFFLKEGLKGREVYTKGQNLHLPGNITIV